VYRDRRRLPFFMIATALRSSSNFHDCNRSAQRASELSFSFAAHFSQLPLSFAAEDDVGETQRLLARISQLPLSFAAHFSQPSLSFAADGGGDDDS